MTHMLYFSESRPKIVEVCVGVFGAEGVSLEDPASF